MVALSASITLARMSSLRTNLSFTSFFILESFHLNRPDYVITIQNGSCDGGRDVPYDGWVDDGQLDLEELSEDGCDSKVVDLY